MGLGAYLRVHCPHSPIDDGGGCTIAIGKCCSDPVSSVPESGENEAALFRQGTMYPSAAKELVHVALHIAHCTSVPRRFLLFQLLRIKKKKSGEPLHCTGSISINIVFCSSKFVQEMQYCASMYMYLRMNSSGTPV
jgi:hypothetical protein